MHHCRLLRAGLLCCTQPLLVERQWLFSRHLDAIAAAALGAIERRIGRREQRVEVGARRAAGNAERKGRFADARLCYQALGDQDALVRISPQLPPSLRTAPPPATAGTA